MNDYIIQKFLSRLADHYNKKAFWIKNFKELYTKAFAKVPARFLETWLEDYLMNEMPQFCPTITDVIKYVRQKPLCEDAWFLSDKKEYCMHCRSEDDGSIGGLRVLSIKYFHPQKLKNIRVNTTAQCDCPATVGTGRVYTQTIAYFRKLDPNCVIHFDYWDFERGGKMSAMHQSDQMWEHRVKHGYVKITEEDDGSRYYEPVWDHDFWESAMGEYMAKTEGWKIPDFVIERRNKLLATRGRNKRNKNRLLSDKAVHAIFSVYDW